MLKKENIAFFNDKNKMKILCFNLTNCSRSTQFVLLSLSVFFFHCFQGYMHELIFRLPGFKPFSIFFTLLQFAIYASLGVIESIFKNGFRFYKTRKISLKTYSVIAFLTVSTLSLSNTSVAYLNYTTFCMFKSCKTIPVMLGSMLLLRKKYTVLEKLSILFITLGLVFFTLADSQVYPNFEVYGVILVCTALVADALVGNLQEKKMKQFESTNTEMIIFSYSIGFIYILIWESVNYDIFFKAINFCAEYPVETYGYISLYSTAGYFGLNVVLTLVKSFDALAAVTVTTLRKFITICISFVWFAKPFTIEYLFSGLLVVLGIYLNVYSKNKKAWNTFFYKNYLRLCGHKEDHISKLV